VIQIRSKQQRKEFPEDFSSERRGDMSSFFQVLPKDPPEKKRRKGREQA